MFLLNLFYFCCLIKKGKFIGLLDKMIVKGYKLEGKYMYVLYEIYLRVNYYLNYLVYFLDFFFYDFV